MKYHSIVYLPDFCSGRINGLPRSCFLPTWDWDHYSVAFPMPSIRPLLFLLGWLAALSVAQARNNLATTGTATTNSSGDSAPQLAIDGKEDTAWQGVSPADRAVWVLVELPGHTEVKEVSFSLDLGAGDAPESFAVQKWMNGRWWELVKRDFDGEAEFTTELGKEALVDQVRFEFFGVDEVAVKEIGVYGQEYAADLSELRPVILNQSGFNRGAPKRFTVPDVADGTVFEVKNVRTGTVEFAGRITGQIGDFSSFNPATRDEYVVMVGEGSSFPFRIGPWWMERVSYRNSLEFMAGARHYIGTTQEIRTYSWEWRDGDFFNWAMQTLVAQYLSNPAAYDRMERTLDYVPNASFPADYQGLWGRLDPPAEDAPDIVKLIHWDADVKLSQLLEHEHQKAELAHFLHAFPFLSRWLPEQNFEVVYAYLRDVWEKPTVRPDSTTKYDLSEGHDLLAVKTKMGTNKGELPPGASVMPNLMMYEAARSRGEADAGKYFDAAYAQMEWMITNLDWEEPMSTKGQRMSEHLTMRAFAYFYHQYPERRPAGLREKVEAWAEVAIRRSDNLWDFRRFTDDAEWAPLGWNETGNILGFPAAAWAAKSVIESPAMRQRLDEIAWAHFDNGFGRNPLGRHSSYDGPREIEGVDLGWFNAHAGGIGLLEPVRFVFDGSPKAEHFPNHPELGNFGWTEGWVQFNIAFNASLALAAHDATTITIEPIGDSLIEIRLRAPLNFHEDVVDQVEVELVSTAGDSMSVVLTEESQFSEYLSARLTIEGRSLRQDNRRVAWRVGDVITASYGLGYLQKTASHRR